MANDTPFQQIVGAAKIWIAPYGATEPAVNTTPSAPWVEMGATDGEQTIEWSGAATFFRDNDHQGPVTAVRPEEDLNVTFTLVNSSQALIARALNDVGKVTTSTQNGATVSQLPNKRGAYLTRYALLIKGAFDSPFGQYPGQNYVPMAVSDSEPTATRGKDARQEWECKYVALEDDAQSEDRKMGWSTVQTG